MAISNRPSLIHPIPSVRPAELVGDKIQKENPLFGLIWINPQRVSGAPCFFGTRVPVKTLFDCLTAGQTLEEFLEDFEGVTRVQTLAVLELAADDLLKDLGQL